MEQKKDNFQTQRSNEISIIKLLCIPLMQFSLFSNKSIQLQFTHVLLKSKIQTWYTKTVLRILKVYIRHICYIFQPNTIS